MITILSNFIIFLIIVYGNGIILNKKLLNIHNNQNFYEISLTGLVFTIILAQFLNFFIPLKNYVIFSNILFLAFLYLLDKKSFSNLKINFKLFLILLILVVSNIYGSNFSEDLDHYHYGIIQNVDKSNFIWGNSFFHDMYGTSPIWLTGHSYFNFDVSRLQDIHVLNGLLLFIFFGLFFTEILKIDINFSFNQIILFSILLFILIKFTRLKEFGIDRPVIIFFCYIIYIYLKYLMFDNGKYILEYFIIILLVSLSIISIKIIYLPILFFSFVYFLKNKNKLNLFSIKYFLILFVLIVFVLKNFLSTGCIIYPIEFSCFDFVSWSNLKAAQELTFLGEYFNKSWTSYEGYLSKEEYVKNFNWFNTWFVRGKVEIIELFATIFLVFVICLTIFGFKKNSYKHTEQINFLRNILTIIAISSFLIFIIKNPVIRMNFHFLISFLIVLLIFFVNFNINENKIKLMKLFIILAFFFNFYKNIDRIINVNFVNDPISTISQKIYTPKEEKLDGFIYYVGWYGNAPIGYKILENKKYKKRFIFNIISKN